MGKKRAEKTETLPLRFDQKLVLNQWMLSLFEVNDFDKLAEHLKPLELEGLDENNVHKFLHQMKLLWDYEEFPGDTLLGYDQNIVKHTLTLSEKRAESLHWKYFQYLSLLFTEVYLDRFFRDPDKLLADLNQRIAKFNEGKTTREQIPKYEPQHLRKLAFWNATGSGKTLLMHVNILQYQYYLNLHGRNRELTKIILLTPNEGLSKQHLEEFDASGMRAELFTGEKSSQSGLLFGGGGRLIEILDIHKLRDEKREKTFAIDAFEGNNLVLVDEGHRGSERQRRRGVDACPEPAVRGRLLL